MQLCCLQEQLQSVGDKSKNQSAALELGRSCPRSWCSPRHSHNDTHGVTSDELRRSEMFTDKSEQKKEQTIMEYQIGRDLKEHLVQPFLSKV